MCKGSKIERMVCGKKFSGWGNSMPVRYNNLEPTTYRYGAVSVKSDFHLDISKFPRGEFLFPR